MAAESSINIMKKASKSPVILVISAPSGAGKSTICRRLIQGYGSNDTADSELVFSVSTTTRDPRDGEIDGEDYDFVSRSRFEQMIDNGEFLESAEVHGELYGTSAQSVREHLEADRDVLLEIDVQGARQVKEKCPHAILVFVVPPSLDELERRLRSRDTESEEQINKRMQEAREELQAMAEYDYVVINDDIDTAVREVNCIRRAEKCRNKPSSAIDSI